MLFLLTGDIQTGKTRWLAGLVEELEATGVGIAGVLAPGVWRERSTEEMAERAAAAEAAAREARAAAKVAAKAARAEGEGADAGERTRRHPDPAGEGRFEKLGIDNLLLPQHERIAFARRGDLARKEGAHQPGSQSARAGLAWEIDDGAVARVNAHFAQLIDEGTTGRLGAVATQAAETGADAMCIADTGAGANVAASDTTGASANAATSETAEVGADASLLVVDELGRLELLRGEGLTEAMRLLRAGPSRHFPHALVVVRAGLLQEAHAALDGIWDDTAEIAPDNESREAVTGLFNRRREQKSRS